jgi:hypothetical protein
MAHALTGAPLAAEDLPPPPPPPAPEPEPPAEPVPDPAGEAFALTYPRRAALIRQLAAARQPLVRPARGLSGARAGHRPLAHAAGARCVGGRGVAPNVMAAPTVMAAIYRAGDATQVSVQTTH